MSESQVNNVNKCITLRKRKNPTDSKNYPLLDAHWCKEQKYLQFTLLKKDASDSEFNYWAKSMGGLINDLSELLILPFDRFWCEILYSKSLIYSLDQFFLLCPRSIEESLVQAQCLPILQQIKALVLLITVRASKPKESDMMYISQATFADLIYEYFVFDAPRLIDFAVLYSQDNYDSVVQVIQSVCTLQPIYIDDIMKTLASVQPALSTVKKKAQQWQFEEDHRAIDSETNSIDRILSMIKYVQEAGTTLGLFLSASSKAIPEISERCIEIGLAQQLAEFYDSIIISLRGQILRNMAWKYSQKTQLMKSLSMAAASIMKTVRLGLVEAGIVSRFLRLAYETDHISLMCSRALTEVARVFLQLMIDFLNHKSFAMAYSLLYRVDEDLSLLLEVAPSIELDTQLIDYVRSAYTSLAVEFSSERLNAVKVDLVPPSVSSLLKEQQEALEAPGPSRPAPYNAVQEVMPHVGSDVIERCLEHYKNDSTAVISALLENTVPASVTNPERFDSPKSRKLSSELNSMNLASAVASGVLRIMPGQVWQGKRDATTPQMLLDPMSPREREITKNLACSVWDDDDESANWYSNPNAPAVHERAQYDPYEDEYDDSYDLAIGAVERVSSDPAVEIGASPRSAFSDTPKKTSPLRGNIVHEKNGDRGQRDNVHTLLVPPAAFNQHCDNEEHSVSGGDNCGSDEMRPTKNVLSLEHPAVIRQRRTDAYIAKAFRKGRVVPSRPDNVPPQRLPEGGEFYPRDQGPESKVSKGKFSFSRNQNSYQSSQRSVRFQNVSNHSLAENGNFFRRVSDTGERKYEGTQGQNLRVTFKPPQDQKTFESDRVSTDPMVKVAASPLSGGIETGNPRYKGLQDRSSRGYFNSSGNKDILEQKRYDAHHEGGSNGRGSDAERTPAEEASRGSPFNTFDARRKKRINRRDRRYLADRKRQF